MKYRSIKRILPAQKVNMGGNLLDQPLPFQGIEQIDPFLLLHHWSSTFPGSQDQRDIGVGPHPHRGFSPVTFIYKGAVHHRDSRGNDDIIHAGGIQWMNSGKGIIHSERPTSEIAKNGGEFEIIQIWVNSPSSSKMIDPSYQAHQKNKIPLFTDTNGTEIQIVCGEFKDNKGPIEATSDLLILNIDMKAGSEIEIPLPNNFEALIYQLNGRAEFSEEETTFTKNMTWFNQDGEGIKLKCEQDARLLFLSGRPIEEPMTSYGPFVMNDQTEIMEAMRDYQMGKMGMLVEEFEPAEDR